MDELTRLIESIGQIHGVDSKYQHNGFVVPRVTAIINKCISNEGLLRWANNLGYRHLSYSKERDKAASIGTQCHNNIDAFLSGEYTDNNMSKEAKYAYDSFQKWYSDIFLLADVEVIMHEKTLTCQYFGGTLDGVYKINDKLYLIDYKTSNHINYNYCLQLAAYRYLLLLEMGIKIDGCIILQLNKQSIGYNEYVLNLDNPDHLEFINQCERAFLSLVYSYYNIMNIEESYKNLNWEVK